MSIELDEQIAEKLFGFWKEEDGDWYGYIINSKGENQAVYASVVAERYILPMRLWGPSIHFGSNLPKFSSDMTAAWIIMQKMKFALTPGYSHNGWNCWKPGEIEFVSAETAPLAICRAALASLGVRFDG